MRRETRRGRLKAASRRRSSARDDRGHDAVLTYRPAPAPCRPRRPPAARGPAPAGCATCADHRQLPMVRTLRAAPPSFSGDDFRAALATFATGVTIVTARTADGQPIGLTANSFNSVSIEPPLVLWSLSRQAGSMPAFAHGSHYAINILAAEVFECFNRSRYEEGDHVIFVGEVERCARRDGAHPLIFHGGRYFNELE